MKRWKLTAVILTVMLCAGMLAACGDKNKDTSTKDTPSKLSESVSVVAYEGAGTDVLKNIDGDYNVRGYDQIKDVEKKVKNGSCDVAVLPTASAAKMYGETKGDIVEISPASRNGVYLLANNYYMSSEKISALANKTIYVTGDDTTCAVVFKYLMSQAGVSGAYTLKVLNSYGEIRKALKDDGNIALVSQPYVKSIMNDNSSVRKLMDLNTKWQDETDTDIMTDVVIANKKFAEKRSSDLQVFINDYAKAEQNTKSAADLVFYGSSNRGTSLLKTFNDTLYSYSSGTFGRSIKDSLYYQAD